MKRTDIPDELQDRLRAKAWGADDDKGGACGDAWTPHAKLRKFAGEQMTRLNGTICWMESSGNWKTARLTVVHERPGKKRFKVIYKLHENKVVTENCVPWDHIRLPLSVKDITSDPRWESWILERIKSHGFLMEPGGTAPAPWRTQWCHARCGLASRAAVDLEAFGEERLLECYQSGWCESEEDEAAYLKAVETLTASIREFKF